MREIIFVILGWLLGLLSHPIALRIEKHYKREDIEKAIFSELGNFVFKLAATCDRIQSHLGIRDKSKLQWLKNMYEKYRIDGPINILEVINKLLEMSDEQLKALSGIRKANENVSLSLKTFSIPFTDSILDNLSVFNPIFQKNIFEIRSQISILNEEIENATFYFRLTFDPACMNANKDIIRKNINDSYFNIQERCRIVADKIDKVLENYKK